MAALSWLLIPVAAVVVAGVWSAWASRRRYKGIPDSAGVAGYERFRAAMERSAAEKAASGSRVVASGTPAEPSAQPGPEPSGQPLQGAAAAPQPAVTAAAGRGGPDGPARTGD